jgi:biopolymer transport protein ExbB
MTSSLLRTRVAGPSGWLTMLLVGCILANCPTAEVAGQVPQNEINALAREAAANRAQPTPSSNQSKGIDFFTLLVQGGVFMIPIAVTSLTVVTFVFDRWIGLRSGRMLPSGLKRGLQQMIRQGDVDPNSVYKLCGEYPSAAANIIRSMVQKTGRPQSEIHSATAEATQREVDRAYANVRWLNLASGIAPLLGLLGTVWGLIKAFHDTTQLTAGQNRADFLAVGIYEALVTTLAGLMVAIPAAVASHYFEGKVTRIFGGIEDLVAELTPRLERFEGRTRFEPIGRELAARDMHSSHSLTPPPIATGLPPTPTVARPRHAIQ